MVLSRFAGFSPPGRGRGRRSGRQVRAGVGVVLAPVLGTALAAAWQHGWGLDRSGHCGRAAGLGPLTGGPARCEAVIGASWYVHHLEGGGVDPAPEGEGHVARGAAAVVARPGSSSRPSQTAAAPRQARRPSGRAVHQARQQHEHPHPPGGLGQQPADLGWLLQALRQSACPRLCRHFATWPPDSTNMASARAMRSTASSSPAPIRSRATSSGPSGPSPAADAAKAAAHSGSGIWWERDGDLRAGGAGRLDGDDPAAGKVDRPAGLAGHLQHTGQPIGGAVLERLTERRRRAACIVGRT